MRKRIYSLLGALLLAAAVLLPLTACDLGKGTTTPHSSLTTGDLQVYYLDVGQGDSELLFLPDGTTVLIDAGDRDCINYITGALKDFGVEQIDILIATHPHADHIGAMATVVRNFDIGTIYMPKVDDSQTPTTVSYEKLLESIAKKDLKVKTGKAGITAYKNGKVKLEFLAPNSSSYNNLNNYSIVAKLTYDDTSFLFLGDAERENLNEMLDRGYDLSCDVMKLGHHGSSNAISKKLMDAAQPSYGIISCGAGNSYGHPHREALKLLQQYDVTTYRTDEDGTILATSDGKTIQFQTDLPSVLPAS
ncbi:MAG: ComEC/Rec2 family competence protein [Oscillospiraceae bacterium]|nr:ComEC/Rec2 family competence protein [Oscillospiraceae bacterium]